MSLHENLYDKYDLLLPSKFDGGYLIIALYEKIIDKEINEQFTIVDIRNILDEISVKYQQAAAQPERLLRILLNFYLRNYIDSPGKYILTDYAKNMVELLKNKLESPFKNFPLKESFEQYFILYSKEIKEISDLEVEFVEDISIQIRASAKQGELLFTQSIDEFIEEFFKKLAKLKDKITIDKLLNPKTYFELSVSLTDQFDNEIPGSTGETYSAIALLGIARLSVVQKEQRAGLRFIILEEIGSLDNTNFNTFPEIAKEFDYQIITMAPHPFNTGLSDEWYAHHLIKGKTDENINFHPSASYFKTKEHSDDLQIYLNKLK